jgi:hypothetical protein
MEIPDQDSFGGKGRWYTCAICPCDEDKFIIEGVVNVVVNVKFNVEGKFYKSNRMLPDGKPQNTVVEASVNNINIILKRYIIRIFSFNNNINFFFVIAT